MHIHLIAVGQRMPSWVQQGYQEYAKRLPPELALRLNEIPLAKRHKNHDVRQLLEQEGGQLLSAVPMGSQVIALDVGGQTFSTPQLAQLLKRWQMNGKPVALLVGGPDGLSPACLTKAQLRWSLSPLTLPHPLVRIILAEQIYRAWSLLTGHPYHRQ